MGESCQRIDGSLNFHISRIMEIKGRSQGRYSSVFCGFARLTLPFAVRFLKPP